MAHETIFTMADVDWSAHVVAESYAVNYVSIFDEWVDAGQKKHKDVIRRKLQGTFQMYFADGDELQAFLTAWKNCRTADSTYPVSLKANNDDVAVRTGHHVYMDFAPVRKRNAAFDDTFEIFEVTIEEP